MLQILGEKIPFVNLVDELDFEGCLGKSQQRLSSSHNDTWKPKLLKNTVYLSADKITLYNNNHKMLKKI